MSKLVRIASLITLAVVALGAGGCYERVISARGFGADRVQIYEPDRTYIPGIDPPRKRNPYP